MHETSFPERPAAIVPFERADRAGVVRVFYGVTRRPADSGFEALRGWATEDRAGVGFPTVKCEVESSRPGYGSSFGWIQWVSQAFPGSPNKVGVVDRFPALRNHRIPFAAMGYSPTFFDAPAFNSLPAVDWRAALFLCSLPMMSPREPIAPLVGLRWGYRITKGGTAPTPYPLEPATGPDWRRVRAELVPRFPGWRFAARGPAGR
jgi:hypothetical protein